MTEEELRGIAVLTRHHCEQYMGDNNIVKTPHGIKFVEDVKKIMDEFLGYSRNGDSTNADEGDLR